MSLRGGQLSIADVALEWLQGRYPTKTAECVASVTGVSSATVRKWFQRSSAPSAPALVKMIEVLPPDFLESLMSKPPQWVRAAARACEREELGRELARIEARMSALMGDDDAANGVAGEMGLSGARMGSEGGGKASADGSRPVRGGR